ncbi:unnamed protein product [Mytilus coruscus]|uniref:C1q domain-containing protein n=1 Tax=Mytilus coruscus TaxID=42192 RepID=A0A6J7ZYM5_MYTCO|nr:unnamed protein product [Mytilus coruscus]
MAENGDSDREVEIFNDSDRVKLWEATMKLNDNTSSELLRHGFDTMEAISMIESEDMPTFNIPFCLERCRKLSRPVETKMVEILMGRQCTTQYLITILSIWHGVSRALLDQGIPSTPKLPADEAAYLHQILNQESALRMELEKQITSLQSSVYSFQQEFLAMKTENNIIKGNLSNLQQDVSRLRLENNALLRNLSTTNHSAGTVMYSAYLSTTINNPHVDQTIIFDKTWTNINNVYNTRSGIFTAPVSGYYLFSLTVTSHSFNTHVNPSLQWERRGNSHSRYSSCELLWTRSVTLIHQMNVGDNIWVSSNDDRITNGILGGNPPLTLFTGHLLQDM